MYDTIKIIIGDEHDCVTTGIASRLLAEQDLRLLQVTGDARQLLSLARQHEPHVVITDIRHPVLEGIEAISSLASQCRQVHVIAFTHHNEINIIDKVVEAGARGYVFKSSGMDELVWAIRTVSEGRQYYCPGAARRRRLFEASGRPLKPAHVEILPYIFDGKSDEEIGRIICRSARTIEGRRTAMKQRLNVKSNAGIIVKAYEAGYHIFTLIIGLCTLLFEDQLADVFAIFS